MRPEIAFNQGTVIKITPYLIGILAVGAFVGCSNKDNDHQEINLLIGDRDRDGLAESVNFPFSKVHADVSSIETIRYSKLFEIEPKARHVTFVVIDFQAEILSHDRLWDHPQKLAEKYGLALCPQSTAAELAPLLHLDKPVRIAVLSKPVRAPDGHDCLFVIKNTSNDMAPQGMVELTLESATAMDDPQKIVLMKP